MDSGFSSGKLTFVYGIKAIGLFVLTAIAEIVGCYLPYLWLRHGRPAWLLAPAAVSLAAFAYLLTLHPTSAGRTYAAYGGVYVTVAVVWMWLVEGQKPDRWDVIGGAVARALGQGSTGIRRHPGARG